MTIEKGRPWGRPGGLPLDGILVRDDREASAALAEARRTKTAPPSLGLLAGDLARTCGASGNEARLRAPDAQTVDLDVGEVLVDGVLHFFVAHLVARRSWWHGPVVAVMNAQFLGRWDVVPRSHPNDGRLDLVEADPGPGDRWKAWRRLPAGTHVPHPAIRITRIQATQLDLAPGTRVWVDGTPLGRARSLSIRCVPDAATAVVA